VVGDLKRCAYERKKQVDLLTLILPFHIDYILRLSLFLTMVTQQQILHRYICFIRLRWSRGSVPTFGTQVSGFKPGRSRRICKGEKIFSTPSFGGEVKPSVPCRRFAISRITWKSNSRRNFSEHFSPMKSSTFRC
jgi:hypothetical protein